MNKRRASGRRALLLNAARPIAPAEMARSMVKVGEALAKGRGLPREVGIAEIVEAVAYLEIEIFRSDGGLVCWRLPPHADAEHRRLH